MIDRKNKVVIVTLAKLQLRDSGEYHCESHLQGSTILLKMITLNVLGELLKEKRPSLKSQQILIRWWMWLRVRAQMGSSHREIAGDKRRISEFTSPGF